MQTTESSIRSALEHPALLYRDDEDYLATVSDFVFGGVMLGEPVLVAVPTRKLGLLRESWGDACGAIEMHDMTVAGRNPGRIIGELLLEFVQRHRGHHVRVVGEPIWAGRDATEYPACVQHEALVNVALAGAAATIICPYDTSLLDGAAIADASRTHPVLRMGERRWQSADYADPLETAADLNVPLGPQPWSANSVPLAFETINESRRFIASFALAAGLNLDRVADTVLAVDELVTNALTHGGGSGRLATWCENGRLVYQVTDAGFIKDPLAGRCRPSFDDEHGRGLTIVHAMSDLVRVHTGPDGTTTRAYFLM